MNVAPYRRAYFALCRELGIDGDLRHEFNLGFVGKESSRTFSVADWRDAVAELQRRNGQNVKPGRPRIKGGDRQRGHGPEVRQGRKRSVSPEAIEWISPAQLEFLSLLASEIEWSVGVDHFIRSRLLHPFRKDAWDGSLETLTRREAANTITALKNMRNRQRGHEPEVAHSANRIVSPEETEN